MNEKELKAFRAILRKQREEVKNSKEAAKALLLELGLITSRGRLKKTYKPAK